MKLKNVAVTVAALVLAVSMTACGSSSSTAASTSEAASAQSETSASSAVAEENSASSEAASEASSSEAASEVSSEAASSEAASSEAASGQAEDAKVKAEFTVTGADGESQTFTLEVTDGEKLSDALVEAGLISEEEAAAGFVTTVNGETADWDKDQAWWCLTDATGEMTTVGVADIALHDGDSYAFTYTK